MSCTRRAVLTGLSGICPATAAAQTSHPALAAWQQPERSVARVLSARVDLESGERVTIRDYIGGRPTVLAVWATWCPPCLVEKPPMAELQARLQAAEARAQVKAVLAFDRARLPDARNMLQQLGADALENARALESAESALVRLFGYDRQSGSVVSVSHYQQLMASALPLTLLIGADGVLLGQHVGSMRRRPISYWLAPSTFDMLQQL